MHEIQITDRMVKEIRTNVEKQFHNMKSGHNMAHLKRVERMALDFLEPGADENLTRVFALLHDADDWKLFPGKTDQPENAVKYLHAAGISDTGIKTICADLLRFGYANRLAGLKPVLPETRAVSDADMCDIMGATGIIRMIEYNMEVDEPFFDPDDRPRKHMTREEYKTVRHRSSCRHIFEKILRLPDMMLTPKGRMEADRRIRTDILFLKALFREENNRIWLDMLEQFLSENGLS